MMKRLKEWILMKVLPMWAKETIKRENDQLREENQRLRTKIKLLEAYTEGLGKGLRSRCRVIVNNGGSNEETRSSVHP